VLTVAGTDRNGSASFDASTQGMTISVAAPSEDLVGVTPGGGHTLWGGTSGAAPIVAGIVALVRAAHTELVTANPMGDLAEWIRVYRRAAAPEAPLPSGVATPTPAPVIAGPADPLGTMLPSVNQLRFVGVPVLVLTVFAALLVWLAVVAVRRFRGRSNTE
jgi:subtilase family serine protease